MIVGLQNMKQRFKKTDKKEKIYILKYPNFGGIRSQTRSYKSDCLWLALLIYTTGIQMDMKLHRHKFEDGA